MCSRPPIVVVLTATCLQKRAAPGAAAAAAESSEDDGDDDDDEHSDPEFCEMDLIVFPDAEQIESSINKLDATVRASRGRRPKPATDRAPHLLLWRQPQNKTAQQRGT